MILSHSDENLKFMIPIILLIITISIYEQGFAKNVVMGIIVLCLFLIFIIIGESYTQVRIENSKTLINKIFLSFGFTADIKSITRIERNYEFILKNWGCRMEVYYTDEYNQEHMK